MFAQDRNATIERLEREVDSVKKTLTDMTQVCDLSAVSQTFAYCVMMVEFIVSDDG
jgi:hypothetical protein